MEKMPLLILPFEILLPMGYFQPEKSFLKILTKLLWLMFFLPVVKA
jgi:hypothetical protein